MSAAFPLLILRSRNIAPFFPLDSSAEISYSINRQYLFLVGSEVLKDQCSGGMNESPPRNPENQNKMKHLYTCNRGKAAVCALRWSSPESCDLVSLRPTAVGTPSPLRLPGSSDWAKG